MQQSSKQLCFLSATLTILATFAIMDGLWLGVLQKGAYQKQFADIQGSPMTVRIGGGIAAYIAMTLIILVFVVPHVRAENLMRDSLMYGALLGLYVYTIYNGTMFATLKNYTLQTAIKDTVWGTLLFAVAAFVGSYAAHHWKILTA